MLKYGGSAEFRHRDGTMGKSEAGVWWPLSLVEWELRLLGLWVRPPGRALRHRLMLGFAVLSHVALLFMVNGSFIVNTPTDLPQISFVAYNCLTDIGLTSKMLSFSLDWERVTELLRQLEAARRRFPDTAGHRARCHSTAVKIHRFMQVTYRVNSAYWFAAPIIRIITASRSEDAAPVRRDLPIPMWVPFDTHPSPVYEILYCLQFAFGWAVSETTVLVDGSLIALILQVVAELAVLNDSLAAGAGSPPQQLGIPASMSYTGDSKAQSPEKSPSLLEKPFPDSPQRRAHRTDSCKDETYQQLLLNVQHHHAILSCVDLLQKVLSRATSVLLICNTISICFQVIATAVLLQEDGDAMQTFKMLMGSTLYAYQVALFCLLGQRIINQSERLPRSAISGDWPDADSRSWHLVLLLSLGSSRAIKLKICGLYTLSRETLLQILNVSYSLLNFIYQTKSDQSVTKHEQ